MNINLVAIKIFIVIVFVSQENTYSSFKWWNSVIWRVISITMPKSMTHEEYISRPKARRCLWKEKMQMYVCMHCTLCFSYISCKIIHRVSFKVFSIATIRTSSPSLLTPVHLCVGSCGAPRCIAKTPCTYALYLIQKKFKEELLPPWRYAGDVLLSVSYESVAE